MRPSEALGLKWTDVGIDRVHIRRTLVTARKGGGWTLEEPKTRGSRRTVTLPHATIQALAWHRTKQEGEKFAIGNGYHDGGLVFAGQGGAPLNLANLTVRHFKPLLSAAGLPNVRLYDLRHTHASLLLAAGVPVNVVSARLGHASAKMTLDVYAHVLSGQQEDAVSRLVAYMEVGINDR
jgi:integrase